MKRRGLVLAFLMRLKQICNHPSQWLGDGAWAEEDSGKLARLRDIAEIIAARQEKALVFTQFKETTAPLAGFLGSVFGRPGLVLHGETQVGKRKDLVRRFQEDEERPVLRAVASRPAAPGSISRPPRMSSISTGGGTRRSRTRPPIGPSASARPGTCSCTNSSASGTVEERIDHMIEIEEAAGWEIFSRAEQSCSSPR